MRIRLLNDELKEKMYRNDILFFAKEELGVTLSKDQEHFLRDWGILENERFLICAARGTGKTYALAIAAIWSVTNLPSEIGSYQVCILGGSKAQSELVYDYIMVFINTSQWIRNKVVGEPLRSITEFKDKGKITVLAAGPKSVRGKHPDCLILDEAAEIEDPLMKAAIIGLDTSKYPRLAVSSTPHIFFSYFVELCEKAEDFGFNNFYKWTALGCPWIKDERIEEMRRQLDERTFNIEYLGKPEPMMGTLIKSEDIRDAFNLEEPPIHQLEAPTFMGIDWGQDHPTVVTILERQGNTLYAMEVRKWRQTKFAYMREQIKKLYEKYDIDIVFADRSHGEMNESLQREGLHLKEIPFGQWKAKMITNLMWTFEQKGIKIPIVEKRMREELGRYTTSTIKGDDHVDSLMLAIAADRERTKIKSKKRKMWITRGR